jgi:AbiV family abortive infection protein
MESQQTRIRRAKELILKNAQRLLADAQMLKDFDGIPSAFALTVLAEEEFAKAFILYLVEMEVIPWTREIARSLNDHSSKHLIGIVVDWVTTFIADFFTELGKDYKNLEVSKLPWTPEGAHAMNIYRHNRVGRFRNGDEALTVNYTEPEEKAVDRAIEKRDKSKQDAIYVAVASDGGVARSPFDTSVEKLREERERADRFNLFCTDFLGNELIMRNPSFRVFADTIKEVFADLDGAKVIVG